MTRHFGIIGFPLEHSFSAELFTKKFAEENIDAVYSLYPIEDIRELKALCERVNLSGLNVTMPYKQTVIPLLDELAPTAEATGAVNVIAFKDGRMIGHNTDAAGFIRSIRPLLKPSDKRALVLGTGGASKAVCYGLRMLGIEPTPVSRFSERGITYGQLSEEMMQQHSVVINATPLGMHPLIGRKPAIPYEWLTAGHLLFDVIYNPAVTPFLEEGLHRGCRTRNGLEMLIGQAEEAWNIWK